MPQGGHEAIDTKHPLDILAYQYDLVLNGYEISSGGVRNHDPELLKKYLSKLVMKRRKLSDDLEL